MKIIDLYQEIKQEELLVLNEANLKSLYTKTLSDMPKLSGRGNQLVNKVRYFGLSKDGTLNFKVSSQTISGKYYYVSIEAPDILPYADNVGMGDHLTDRDLAVILTKNNFRVHCGCPSWLYYAFQYMATVGNYEIEPETREPKRNNTSKLGALCKHLVAVVKNLFENKEMRAAIIKDIENYLRMLNGMEYEDYQQLKHANQIKQQNRAVKWKNKPSDYMNDYFARKAKNHQFLDDHDIKSSLKREANKFVKAHPQASVDDFLRSYFQMTQKAFADDMGIPENTVEDYFNELGFEEAREKGLFKQEQKAQKDLLNQGIVTKDSEQLHEAEEYLTKEQARKQYLHYLEGHIKNAQDALELIYREMHDIPFISENITELRKICKDHDKSKYDAPEFEPYLHHFYPTNKDEEHMSEEFEQAVRHHINNNKHHWDYWVDSKSQELIPDIDEYEYKLYCVERVCDWLAMAKQHNEGPTEWYNLNKKAMIMPDYGFELIDEIINRIPEDYKESLSFDGTRGELD